MIPLSAARAREILDVALGKSVAVIGDFMLDRHLKGSVNRISPEAPVPVVEIESESTGLGGAGNVVNNLAALGIKPMAFGVVGSDPAGAVLLGHLQAVNAVSEGIIVSANRRTTEKIRIIARDQHVVRADRESNGEISTTDSNHLRRRIEAAWSQMDAIILQDYNKGVLGAATIDWVMKQAAKRGIPVSVDPKFENFFEYVGAHLFKPNVRELERALGIRLSDNDALLKAGRLLYERIAPQLVLVTRGERGMTLFEGREQVLDIPTRAMKVHDVSGAGDTVISTFVCAEAGGATHLEAAILSNYAAGVVCGEVGVVPIERELLLAAVAEHD